jgi:hypothetical protein
LGNKEHEEQEKQTGEQNHINPKTGGKNSLINLEVKERITLK